MVTAKKIRLVNPHKAKTVGAARAPRKARKRPNPGALYLLGKTAAAFNPHKGAKKMAQQKPAKKKPAARKNPQFAGARPAVAQVTKKRRKHSKNPMGLSLNSLSQPIELLKFGLIALFGLVATRQIPQMALAEKNESWLGYGSNLGTALGGAYATSRIAGKTAGIAFGTGGGLYTVNRFLTEKFTPVGKVLSLSGLGDAQASASLGRIIPGAVYPPSYDNQGRLRLPPVFVDAMRASNPQPAGGSAMSGGRMRGNARVAA
jgi:hypothetical protein